MRIAFVSEVWHPAVNGVVTRLAMTVEQLLLADHEVLILAPRVKGEPEDARPTPGLRVRRIPSFRIGWIYQGQPWGLPLPRVTRFLAEFEPDLVHVVSPAMLGAAGVIGAKQLKLPLVASFHTDIASYARFYHLGFIRPFVWWVLRQLHNRADLNLVTSSHSAALMVQHRIGRVQLWRRGVDLERFTTQRRKGSESGRRPLLPVALYVGRLAAEKGLDKLTSLAHSNTVRLVLVGEGPDQARLTSMFAGTPTEFPGPRTGEELAQAYADADVFVFPSTTETLGLVLLEALASGLPIVAADSPASRELLASCPAARLFPAKRPEAVLEAVTDLLASAPQSGLARLARTEAAQWNWAAATEQLLQYYAEALSGRPE